MTTTLTSSHIQQLTERIEDWRTADVLVDKTQRAVRNVALTATDSRNGYRYSEEALRNAVPLYENKPVFLDHAANLSRPFDRSTRDLVGTIVNVRFEEGRVRADIQTIDTESGRTFIALAGSDTPSVGMSHVVLAERGRDKSVVERIHDVISVDAVVFPATASTFRESLQDQSAITLPGSYEAALSSIDEELPEHVRQLQEEEFSQIRRLGLFPDQVLVESQCDEETPAEYYSLDWSIQDGRVVLGEKLIGIPSDSIHDGSWVSQKHEQVDAIQAELERVIAERDELRRCVDQFELDQRASRKQKEIKQLIEEAKLPAEYVTDAFKKQLFSASDLTACREILSERQELVQQLSRQSPVSRERTRGKDSCSKDTAIVSAIRGQRGSVLSGVRL